MLRIFRKAKGECSIMNRPWQHRYHLDFDWHRYADYEQLQKWIREEELQKQDGKKVDEQ